MYPYNRNDLKKRIQTPNLRVYIELLRKYEAPNIDYGGQVNIKYQKIWTGSCEWNVRREIELIDQASGVPVKYINNIRIRIPYLDKALFAGDYFIRTKPENMKYKILNITDEFGDSKWLTLELEQWEKDNKNY